MKHKNDWRNNGNLIAFLWLLAIIAIVTLVIMVNYYEPGRGWILEEDDDYWEKEWELEE